jgi:S1-C subfamily serine protease/pSer/pThr/pTyr-binding forkhead associated (FHA) protein
MRIEFLEGPRKGETLNLDQDSVVVGRDRSADVTVADEEVSRRHVELSLSNGSVEVRDLGSQNGTKVGRSKVTDARTVSPSDQIKIGNSVFTVQGDGAEAGATRVAGSTRGGTRGRGDTVGGTRMARGTPAMLEVVSGPAEGKTIEVTGAGMSIGRDPSADVQLGDDEISREHIEVKSTEAGVEVTDLGSRNGTVVDGKRISKTTLVKDGSDIGIGRSRLKVSTVAAGRSRPRALAGGGGRRLGAIAAGVGAVALVVAILAIAGVFGGSSDDNQSSAPLTTPQIVSKVAPSTVQIVGRIGGGRTVPLGTGWVYDAAKGLVVTNAHVVSCCDVNGHAVPVNSYAVSIDKFARRADIYAEAPCEDLAILRTTALDKPDMELGSQSDVKAGDKAVAFGYPENFTLDQEPQVTEGTVSVAKTRSEALDDPDFQLYPNVIQTDAAINPGNSGGPLLNDKGQLIGVTTFGATATQNQNFAIGVDQVKSVLGQMADGDSLEWSGFGFKATGSGLTVLNVIPNTGSDQAGLSQFIGAPITAINGRPVATREDYCNAVENVTSGESAPVELFGGAAAGRIVFQ